MGRAEPGQQFFLRVPDPGHGPAARARAGPDIGRGQQQARVLGRLQREFDSPGRVSDGGFVAGGGAGAAAAAMPVAAAGLGRGRHRRRRHRQRPGPRRLRRRRASAGSTSRKQVRTGPAGACAALRQAARSAARVGGFGLVFRGQHGDLRVRRWPVRLPSVRRRGCGPGGGRGCAGSRLKPGWLLRLARAAASVSASSASVSTSADDAPPAVVARHSGGIAAARSRARCASAPDSTGHQRAA